MTAFAAAVDALFADPHLAEDAVWHGPLGAVDVRVIRSRPDEGFELYGQRGVVPSLRLSARVSEMTPEEGQIIEIGGMSFTVIGAPRRDAPHLVWTFDAVETAP